MTWGTSSAFLKRRLPIRPLDGWAIQRQHPRLLVALGFGIVALGAAFALGLL